MSNFFATSWCVAGAVLLLGSPSADAGDAVSTTVRVAASAEGVQLLRGDKPYFIRGAGGDGDRELLDRVGGNSVRTWGAENL